MTSNEIRASFLKFFEQEGHRIVPGSSLVPHDDPTLLFTNAGMNQFKDVFLGEERRHYARAASSQKCMRVSGKHNDLENVGPSLRHHTFFEMLGNFSFGDYFKKDAIAFAWELLTDAWKIPPDRLHATVFSGEAGVPRDEEARERWLEFLPADRMTELGLADNFWQMGETGPCGRCSEVHYFRGNHLPCPEPVCLGLACSCDRYVEIWNIVFMEFDRQPGGQLNPLPAPSIDTGMGLERVTAVLQGIVSDYDTDLFKPLLNALGEIAGTTYKGTMEPRDISMRVVADHMRAMTFLIADGVIPSNEHRGYVLRKIMRRAMRHGMKLSLTKPFLYRLVDVLVREMSDAYPELKSNRDTVIKVIRSEEERFVAVLAGGLPKLEEAIDRAASSRKPLPGEEAFRLYDTFGLPLDFIEDLAGERHVAVDRGGFEEAMESQREKARAKSSFKTAEKETWYIEESQLLKLRTNGDKFQGYDKTALNDIKVLVLYRDDPSGPRPISKLQAGESGYVALSATPFYLESGGQVSDKGLITSPQMEAIVDAVTRIPGMLDIPRLHRVSMKRGVLTEGDLATAEVDPETRDATRRNHTATHLLHAALRKVLGAHVRQAGSLVAPDRLRFDFVHHAAVTPDELAEIERLVNEQVRRNTPVVTEERSAQEAMAAGAMALFGEKYGDRVRVVSIPGFSMELCGGTHCRATGDIGFLTIVSEGGIAAGVRRIEALTGGAAVTAHQTMRFMLSSADETAEKLLSQVKVLERQIEKQRANKALEGLKAALDKTIGDIRIVGYEAAGLEKDALRGLIDSRRGEIKSGVVVVGSAVDDRVLIAAGVTPDLTNRISAGLLVKALAPIVGGRGGGRADFAEAGGNDPAKIKQMIGALEGLIAAAPPSTKK